MDDQTPTNMEPLTDQVNTLLTMLGYDIPSLSTFWLNDVEPLKVEVGKRCIAVVKDRVTGKG